MLGQVSTKRTGRVDYLLDDTDADGESQYDGRHNDKRNFVYAGPFRSVTPSDNLLGQYMPGRESADANPGGRAASMAQLVDIDEVVAKGMSATTPDGSVASTD